MLQLLRQAGAAQRRRNAALTNAFPTPPPLGNAAPTQQHTPGTVTVARWGATPYQKRISAGDLRAMRSFAVNAQAGVPQRLQSWIPACSARAVAPGPGRAVPLSCLPWQRTAQ